MRNGTKTVLLMSLLIFGCSEEPEHSDSINLGIVSINFPENPKVTQVINRREVKSWKLRFESDSLYLMIYDSEKDTNAIELNQQGSISLYDMYLSASAIEREKYLIKQVTADGVEGRIISRNYSDSTNYIELYFKNTCGNNCQVLIHGTNLSDKTYPIMENLYKNLTFKCSGN